MASTIFTDYVTIITAEWLNAVNSFVYGPLTLSPSTGAGTITGDWNVGGNLNVTGNIVGGTGTQINVKNIIGPGQSWHNVTSTRSPGTVYTNNDSSQRAIFVFIQRHSTTVGGPTVNFFVESGVGTGVYVAVGVLEGNYQTSVSAIVPYGCRYYIENNATGVQNWAEFYT